MSLLSVSYLLIMATILTVVLIRHRKINSSNRLVSINNYESVNKMYNCPNCGIQMQSGYRIINEGIFWTTEFVNTNWKALTQIPIENTASGSRNNVNKAWKCTKCKMILIDHNVLLKH